MQLNGVFFWTLNSTDSDVFVPPDFLADFCVSKFFVRGNLFVPPSSNLSLWRNVNDSEVRGLIVSSKDVFMFGRLVVSIPKSVPKNGTLLRSLMIGKSFQRLPNEIELMADGESGIDCRTLNFGVVVSPGNLSDDLSVELAVFNQCENDAFIFLIVVACFGGLLGMLAVALIIVSVMKFCKNFASKSSEPKYTPMQRT